MNFGMAGLNSGGNEGRYELVQYLATQECGARILVISGYAQRYFDNTKALGEAFGLMLVTSMSKLIELPKLEEYLNAA